jgi:hypothetical protein
VDEDRSVVAPVLVAFAVAGALAYLPVAVGRAGNFAPVHVTVAITLLAACFITPAIAGYFIGRSRDEARQLALIVLIVGLPAIVTFAMIASGVLIQSISPLLIVVFLIMFAALLGYVRGREGPVR